jgi:hypothetical protein
MNTRDLLEMASLDALGLLDEQERDDFERAFRDASPALKAQLRREQSRFADLDKWLPAVEPPASLRGRVLGAVREAIAAVSAPEPAVVARIGPFPMPGWWNTASLWRAACIGFATASVVLAGFFFYISQENRRIGDLALNNRLNDFNRFGAGGNLASIESSKNYKRVVFEGVVGGVPVKALAWMSIDTEKREATLFCYNLPVQSGYALMLEPASGAAPVLLKEFDGGSGLSGSSIKLSIRPGEIDPLLSLDRLAIVGPALEGGPDVVIMRVREA